MKWYKTSDKTPPFDKEVIGAVFFNKCNHFHYIIVVLEGDYIWHNPQRSKLTFELERIPYWAEIEAPYEQNTKTND